MTGPPIGESAPRRIEAVGDAALRWRRDPTRDARSLLDALRSHPGVVDAVVTELHALVTFDPARPPEAPWTLEERVPRADLLTGVGTMGREHVLRARYDGPDLDEVAARTGLSCAETIRLHTEAIYTVRFVGFLPGFAYLGPVPSPLALARRAIPRPRVEPGSIGLAGGYTGIYPFASPGGWQLVGHAVDFRPFDVVRGALLALGDRVRFEAVR